MKIVESDYWEQALRNCHAEVTPSNYPTEVFPVNHHTEVTPTSHPTEDTPANRPTKVTPDINQDCPPIGVIQINPRAHSSSHPTKSNQDPTCETHPQTTPLRKLIREMPGKYIYRIQIGRRSAVIRQLRMTTKTSGEQEVIQLGFVAQLGA